MSPILKWKYEDMQFDSFVFTKHKRSEHFLVLLH